MHLPIWSVSTSKPNERLAERGPAPGTARPLGEFIRERRDDILEEWLTAVRAMPVARDLDRPTLVDHIPELLERIAQIADALGSGNSPDLPADLAESHALERLSEGFDLGQVAVEFSVLRDCITRLWEERQEPQHMLEYRVLNQSIDKAVNASINRYMKARDRTLEALDRISNAALESRSLDEFLDRLLSVLVETTPAVDTCTIMLREGDRLRIRASVGIADMHQTQGITEGFAGTIATSRQPLEWPSESAAPPVIDGVRAFYGLPLADGGEVIAVAYMGSRTANEFSKQDKRLFAAMTIRAAAAIYQHMLREQAEQAIRIREEVLAIVSHDLRSPLNVIDLTASNLLHDHGAEPDIRRQLEVIRRSSDRMEHLINDLLDLATIEAKGLTLTLTSQDATKLVTECVEAQKVLAAEKRIAITVECDLQARRLRCDRDRIEQVFGNLLGNAIKYCRPDDAIHVRCEIIAATARFTVSDTGSGISPEELPHLFRPYWAAKRDWTKPGTGLGLYICKGIVEAHGGTIGVESTPGQGTTFFFTIPLDTRTRGPT